MPFMVLLWFSMSFPGLCPASCKREAKAVPLCVGCFHAHLQHGANAKRVISYTYDGAARPIKLDVLYRNDYQTRNPTLRPRAIGFVREIVPAD